MNPQATGGSTNSGTEPNTVTSKLTSAGVQSNLSRSQLMIWTGQQLNPGVPLYNMALRFDLQGDIEVEVFQSAFQALIDRCDAMRTVFVEQAGVPMQHVQPRMNYRMELIDLADEPDVATAVEKWILQRSQQEFDLGACCFDSALIRTGPASLVWYLNQHHLTTDAWSTSLIYRELARLYARLLAGGLHEDGEPMPAYADYLAYERKQRGTPVYTNAVAYWDELAARQTPRVNMYGQNPAVRGNRTERLVCPLGQDRSQALRKLAETPGIRMLSLDMTLFKLFATVLFAYLYRVGGRTTQVIGTPAHNRSSLAFRETVGLFMELFPLRVELQEEETFRSLLEKTGAGTQAYLRNVVPGASSPNVMRLFNVVLNYIHASFESFNGTPMQPQWVHTGYGDPEHDLRLQVHDFGGSGSLVACFDFNCTTFPGELRQHAMQHFLRMLDACLADPDQQIGTVDLTSAEERRRYVVDFNHARKLLAAKGTVIDLFRQQSELNPGRTAISLAGTTVSYRELDQRSDRLARLITGRGVGRGVLVGIYIERSIEMVLGILAVLKAGAAYVPLESSLPAKRLAYILEDTAAHMVLTRKGLEARLPATAPQRYYLDADRDEAADQNIPLPDSDPTSTAYVIYTSGSTGMPKGVVVDHEGLSAYADWARKTFTPQDQPVFPLYSSFGFDLTVTSIFVPLICGGSIVVYPEEAGITDLAVLRVFEEGQVDTVKLTPAHLRLVADLDLRDSSIRTLILGGEDLKSVDARRVISASGGQITVLNEYGPTEGVVGCMVHRFDPDKDKAVSVPIGVPADGVSIYLLDAGRNPVPEGVTGEIHIGGSRLARSYFKRQDLTAERFLPDPFSHGGRMYRTGDLGRFNSDGILEYLGRNDEQLKLRGVRIEPAEIEQSLLDHPAIDACVLNVTRIERHDSRDDIHYCSRCGLASNCPGTRIDANGVCNLCNDYQQYRDRAQAYFGSMEALREIFAEAQASQSGLYDCMMLLSGGKDSTYALYQVARIAKRVLAVTLDNGFVSDGAKANIGRVVSELGIDHRYLQTPAMNAIFVDSLERHSNVCHGCFKTLYTLAVETALQEAIPLIVTGLSRGQFFETRLTPVQFQENRFDVETIDQTVLEARKAYHRIDDGVSRLLNVDMFKDDKVFEQIKFVDFYRYSDVSLDAMYSFLAEHAPWIRPGDTGRSTNCLINDAGIYVHKHKEGFHNYALPYSWDVRLGHKQRDAALDELNDRIDIEKVHQILQEIGYHEEGYLGEGSDTRLTAFFTAGKKLSSADLRAFLAERLPVAMIPASLVQLEAIPLTANGKVDRDALPDPRPGRPVVEEVYKAPRDGIEVQLANLWRTVLRIQRVGIDDNFFDLGGDSISAIQIVAKANDAGIPLSTHQLFQHQTVADLAAVVQDSTQINTGVGTTQEQARRTGEQLRPFIDRSKADVDKKELDKLAALLKKN
jgi:amino acid adenylation domain-containing protein